MDGGFEHGFNPPHRRKELQGGVADRCVWDRWTCSPPPARGRPDRHNGQQPHRRAGDLTLPIPVVAGRLGCTEANILRTYRRFIPGSDRGERRHGPNARRSQLSILGSQPSASRGGRTGFLLPKCMPGFSGARWVRSASCRQISLASNASHSWSRNSSGDSSSYGMPWA